MLLVMYVPKILYEVNTSNKYTQKNSILKNPKPQLFQYIKMAHFFDARRSYVPYLFYVVSLNLIKRRY